MDNVMLPRHPSYEKTQGFTLLELSIVIVIIGLIAGGILVGRDLIRAAKIRAQISQIQKYQAAVNTFRLKYNGLPGDLANPDAAAFGFSQRGPHPGEGDGNGIIEGVGNGFGGDGNNSGVHETTGETAAFWVDLAAAGLIEGTFTSNSEYVYLSAWLMPNSPDHPLAKHFPQAKLNSNLWVYVYSYQNANYLAISEIQAIDSFGMLYADRPAMTVQQAFAIDSKIDDGLPQSGKVTAEYLDTTFAHDNGLQPVWAHGNDSGASDFVGPPDGSSPTPASDYTCYDNGGVAGTQHYSTGWKDGSGANCGLSFQF
jgi:prepilin-type N-terminal cleavage/methylation domain-containing protein